MSFLWTIATVMFNFWTLALVLGVAAATALILYLPPPAGGPVRFWQIAKSPLTIGALGLSLFLIYTTNSVKVIQKQEDEIHQNEVQTTTTNDGVAVLTDNADNKKKNTESSTRVKRAQEKAPPGKELDAVLDEIAKEQCSDPANRARPDCLR